MVMRTAPGANIAPTRKQPRAFTLRFLGDLNGYQIRGAWFLAGRPTGWQTVYIGITDRRVQVNADLAYLIESEEDSTE